jgi:flagellar hook assembly protein FlgD
VLEFTVVNQDHLQIEHVLNYPNPFTTKTFFWFEHNFPGTDLSVKLEVFTVSGKLIKTITQTINTPGNRSSEIEWDGRDEQGNRIGRGVYIYRLRVKGMNGKAADKWQRLVILGK